MHFNIVSHIGATVKDSGFSIDELVVRMQELFTQKAFPELLREILMLFNEMIKILVMKKSKLPFACECGENDFVLDGTRDRKLRTPIGTVDLSGMTRVKCPHCGRTYVPLMEICGIEAYQSSERCASSEGASRNSPTTGRRKASTRSRASS